MAALKKVKNTRSLLEAIIFHRKMDIQIYSGAAVSSYMRQVIVDFFDAKWEDGIELHNSASELHYTRQSIIDFFSSTETYEQKISLGSAELTTQRLIIREG